MRSTAEIVGLLYNRDMTTLTSHHEVLENIAPDGPNYEENEKKVEAFRKKMYIDFTQPFVMGKHERLGERSAIQILDNDCIKLICNLIGQWIF